MHSFTFVAWPLVMHFSDCANPLHASSDKLHPNQALSAVVFQLTAQLLGAQAPGKKLFTSFEEAVAATEALHRLPL